MKKLLPLIYSVLFTLTFLGLTILVMSGFPQKVISFPGAGSEMVCALFFLYAALGGTYWVYLEIKSLVKSQGNFEDSVKSHYDRKAFKKMMDDVYDKGYHKGLSF